MADDVSPGLGLGGEDSPWAHDMPVPPAPPLPASWTEPMSVTASPPPAPARGVEHPLPASAEPPHEDRPHEDELSPTPSSGLRRSRPALIGAGIIGIVAALIVGSQFIGNDDDDESGAAANDTASSITVPPSTDRPLRSATPPNSVARDRPSTSASLPAPMAVWETTRITLDPRLRSMVVPTQLVVLNGAGGIHVIDIPTGAMRSIETGIGRSNLAMVVGDRAIAVTSYDDGSLVVVDPEGGVADVELAGGAGQMTARPGTNDFVVIPNNWSGNQQPPHLLVAADGTASEITDGPLAGYDMWTTRYLPATGEAVVDDSGGTYGIDALGTVRRISTGDVVAVGDNHVLVRECDETLVCAHVRVDAVSGERQPAIVPDLEQSFRGFDPTIGVSPDGSMMTYLDWASGPQERRLVRLDTGTSEEIDSNDRFGYGSNAGWAADSSGIFVIDDRRLVFHDTTTGARFEVAPGLDVGTITAVASRSNAG